MGMLGAGDKQNSESACFCIYIITVSGKSVSFLKAAPYTDTLIFETGHFAMPAIPSQYASVEDLDALLAFECKMSFLIIPFTAG